MSIAIQNISRDETVLKNELNIRTKESESDPEKNFENNVWTTLYSIGKFTTANINNEEAKVTHNKITRKVDVYLDNDNITLYVEASTEQVGTNKVDKIVGKFADYRDSAEAHAEEKGKNASFIFYKPRQRF